MRVLLQSTSPPVIELTRSRAVNGPATEVLPKMQVAIRTVTDTPSLPATQLHVAIFDCETIQLYAETAIFALYPQDLDIHYRAR